MRESKVEDHLVKRTKELGGEVRKVKWIGRVGAPDRLVMLPVEVVGRSCGAIWVELKATGAAARPSQLREHDRMAAMGQRVHVVDSIEGVDALLHELTLSGRRRPREARMAIPPSVVPSVDAMAAQGHSSGKIGQVLGVSFQTVLSALNRKGAYASVPKAAA